jgi:hypothetical protein
MKVEKAGALPPLPPEACQLQSKPGKIRPNRQAISTGSRIRSTPAVKMDIATQSSSLSDLGGRIIFGKV